MQDVDSCGQLWKLYHFSFMITSSQRHESCMNSLPALKRGLKRGDKLARLLANTFSSSLQPSPTKATMANRGPCGWRFNVPRFSLRSSILILLAVLQVYSAGARLIAFGDSYSDASQVASASVQSALGTSQVSSLPLQLV